MYSSPIQSRYQQFLRVDWKVLIIRGQVAGTELVWFSWECIMAFFGLNTQVRGFLSRVSDIFVGDLLALDWNMSQAHLCRIKSYDTRCWKPLPDTFWEMPFLKLIAYNYYQTMIILLSRFEALCTYHVGCTLNRFRTIARSSIQNSKWISWCLSCSRRLFFSLREV